MAESCAIARIAFGLAMARRLPRRNCRER